VEADEDTMLRSTVMSEQARMLVALRSPIGGLGRWWGSNQLSYCCCGISGEGRREEEEEEEGDFPSGSCDANDPDTLIGEVESEEEEEEEEEKEEAVEEPPDEVTRPVRRPKSPAAKRQQKLVEKTSEDALRRGLEV
jgi:hypothetical protein